MRVEPIKMMGLAGTQPRGVPADEELIKRTLLGEREAFGELALRYEAAVFRHLRRLVKSREDAEEMTQETLLRAYRALPDFRRHEAFGPWLFCIATNLARDSARRAGSRLFESDDELESIPDERAVNAAEELDRHRQFRRVEEALRQLPATMQSILNLHYREGLKLTQIAKVLGQDARAIRVAAHRARLRLRKMLAPEEGMDGRD
jgi:RNA polymerase sigma-70 factor (ECF subfamily)